MKTERSKSFRHNVLVACTVGLLIGAVAVPILTSNAFNPDLRVTERVLESNSDLNVIEALLDNSLVLYLAKPLASALSPGTAVTLLHFLGVAVLGRCLLRHFSVELALSLCLFCFFSILLNQFRFALALGIGLPALLQAGGGRIGRGIRLFAATASHAFGGMGITAVWLTSMLNGETGWIQRGFVSVGVGVAFTYVLFASLQDELRFGGYFEREPGDISYSFLFCFLYLGIFWNNLKRHQRISLAITALVSTVALLFPAISGRLAEFVVVIVLGLASSSVTTNRQRNWALLIALLFFSYRFVRWVLLNQMPDVPSEM